MTGIFIYGEISTPTNTKGNNVMTQGEDHNLQDKERGLAQILPHSLQNEPNLPAP